MAPMESLNGMIYVTLNLHLKQIEVDTVKNVIGVTFLPKLGDKSIPTVNDGGNSLYTVIDSIWNYLGKDEPPYFIKVGNIFPSN
jgi:hypothetical protein